MTKEIKIVVERKNGLTLVQRQQSFAGHLSPKGIIERARETEYLPRRLKKPGGWRFFDLGQLLQGENYVDVNFTGDAGITPNYADKVVEVNESVPAADLATKNNYYLGESLENLATKFLQIRESNAELFELKIAASGFATTVLTPSNPRWDAGKVKIEESETLEWLNIEGNPLFDRITIFFDDVMDSQGAKLTALPDFNAPEINVGFVLSRSADFFLMPTFGTPAMQAEGRRSNDRPDLFNYTSQETGTIILNVPYDFTHNLYTNFLTFPRNALLGRMATWKSAGYALTDFSPFGATTYEMFYAVADYLEALPGTRNFRQLQGKITYQTYDENGDPEQLITENKTVLEDAAAQSPTWAFPYAQFFPAPPATPIVTDEDNYASVYTATWFAEATSGELVMIIRQNGAFYYVWKR